MCVSWGIIDIEESNNKQTNTLHLCSFVCFFAHDNRTLFRKSALAPTKDQKYQRRLFLSGMEIILHMTHAVRVQPLCYFCCCLLTTTPHVVSSACSRCAWLTSVSVLFSLSAVVFTVFTVKPAPTTVGRGASSRKRTHKEPVVLPRLQRLVSAAVIVSPVTALVLWTQVLPGSASFLFILANAMKKPQRPPFKMNEHLFILNFNLISICLFLPFLVLVRTLIDDQIVFSPTWGWLAYLDM